MEFVENEEDCKDGEKDLKNVRMKYQARKGSYLEVQQPLHPPTALLIVLSSIICA